MPKLTASARVVSTIAVVAFLTSCFYATWSEVYVSQSPDKKAELQIYYGNTPSLPLSRTGLRVKLVRTSGKDSVLFDNDNTDLVIKSIYVTWKTDRVGVLVCNGYGGEFFIGYGIDDESHLSASHTKTWLTEAVVEKYPSFNLGYDKEVISKVCGPLGRTYRNRRMALELLCRNVFNDQLMTLDS